MANPSDAKKSKEPKLQKESATLKRSKAATESEKGDLKWTRIDIKIALPEYVRNAVQRLSDSGHVAYVVGGSVRDALLSRTPKDHDLATSAPPEIIESLFPNAITVGRAFGVFKVPIPGSDSGGPTVLEIATFREDFDYRDHRRPTAVHFSGPEEDARRRDFTINALFYDPKTGMVLDEVGGLQDLKEKKLRAIGDPNRRFQEDALRLLRMVRIGSVLGFEIDRETLLAARSRAGLIRRISAERVRDELSSMLCQGPSQLALKQLMELGLLSYLIPELEALKGVDDSAEEGVERRNAWARTLKVIEVLGRNYSKRSVILAWASLLINIGKPKALSLSQGRNFNGHEQFASELSREITRRMRLTHEETETIATLLQEQLKFKDVFQMREATLIRWLREPYFSELLKLHQADAQTSGGNLAYFEFCSGRFKELMDTPELNRLISGADLIELGFEPGPLFSRVLREVDDLTLEGSLKTKDEALEYVLKHFVR